MVDLSRLCLCGSPLKYVTFGELLPKAVPRESVYREPVEESRLQVLLCNMGEGTVQEFFDEDRASVSASAIRNAVRARSSTAYIVICRDIHGFLT